MFFENGEIFKRVVLSSLIGMISMIGDVGLKCGKTHLKCALFDNLTHACVGGLSWTLILNLSRKTLSNYFPDVILCFTLSSLVDVDHFIMARSWRLDVSYLPVTWYFVILLNVNVESLINE